VSAEENLSPDLLGRNLIFELNIFATFMMLKDSLFDIL
jgi:hypothetical protein